MAVDEIMLDRTLLELGHDDFNRGTKYIRAAVKSWDERPDQMLTKELYPALAKAYNTTPARVERCMRHAIGRAWERCEDKRTRYFVFGNSVSAYTGIPTVGQYVARLARHCREVSWNED